MQLLCMFLFQHVEELSLSSVSSVFRLNLVCKRFYLVGMGLDGQSLGNRQCFEEEWQVCSKLLLLFLSQTIFMLQQVVRQGCSRSCHY